MVGVWEIEDELIVLVVFLLIFVDIFYWVFLWNVLWGLCKLKCLVIFFGKNGKSWLLVLFNGERMDRVLMMFMREFCFDELVSIDSKCFMLMLYVNLVLEILFLRRD